VVLGVETLDLAHSFDGTLLEGVAAKGVGGVGGIDDDAATVEYVDYAVEISARVVLFVEFQ
jgi:hypothetical protein